MRCPRTSICPIRPLPGPLPTSRRFRPIRRRSLRIPRRPSSSSAGAEAAPDSARWRTGAAPTRRNARPAGAPAARLPLPPATGPPRLSVVSGLDVLGIPVAQVCRPLSRSMSVSQGKGFSLAEAKVSAIGEAMESWHAERIGHPLWYGGWTEVSAEAPVVDVTRLARPAHSVFHADAPLLWIEGRDLVGGANVLLPLETVLLGHRLPRVPGRGCFLHTSTGLAGGASV